MTKYDEIMNEITVTEAMKNRILKNIEATDFSKTEKLVRFPKYNFLRYKKYLSIAACLTFLVVLGVLLPGIINITDAKEPSDVVGVPYINEMASADELSNAVGFEVKDIAALASKAESVTYTDYGDGLAEINYTLGISVISCRKSPGSEDNSGDYIEYENISEIDVDGVAVTLKGEGNIYHVAVWTDDGYAYSIYSADGVSEQDMKAYVNEFE